MNNNEFKGKTVDEALAKGLQETGLSESEVNVEIVSTGGFLKKAVVIITAKTPVSTDENTAVAAPQVNGEAAEKKETAGLRTKFDPEIKSADASVRSDDEPPVVYVRELLELMGCDVEVHAFTKGETLHIKIKGDDAKATIGFRGEVLDALQYLTLLYANKNGEYGKRILIDTSDYRTKRAETLERLAKKLASEAYKLGKAIELEPMNPFERRVMHTVLQDNKYVTTSSEGVDPNRFVVITPRESTDELEHSYSAEKSNNFKKKGLGKTRSFGNKSRRF